MSRDQNRNMERAFFAGTAVALSVFAFGVLDLARQFSSHLQKMEHAVTPADVSEVVVAGSPGTTEKKDAENIKRGESLYFACTSCHGDKGQGNMALNAPALNVQEDWYIVRQLEKFKDGVRGTDPNDIPGMQMRPMALTLKNKQAMKDLAAYITTFKSSEPLNPPKTITGDVDRGRDLYLNCIACHGNNGQGNETLHVPSLAGQHDWYILMQLKNFKEGIRGADPRDASGAMMRPMAMTLPTEQAMNDVTAYISTLQLTPQSQTKSEEISSASAGSVSGPPDPETGEKIFATNCAACHQENGEGHVGLAPSIRNRDFLAIASDDFIRRTIITGRPGTAMVPRPDLSGQKIDHIIAFLRALPIKNPVEIEVDPEKQFAGDPTAGSTSYSIYCSSCHGPYGEGYSAGGSGPGIGLPGFLLTASDDYIFQTVKHGRVGTAMRPFLGADGLANLNEGDIADIIAHLRSLDRNKAVEVEAQQTAATTVKANPHKGQSIFAVNCAACHQKNGEGKVGLAPSIRNRDFLAVASDEFIRETIRNGRIGTAMVPRPDLSDTDVSHVIAFLRSLPISNPVTVRGDSTRKISGDTIAGSRKFQQYCASCHGSKGEGYSAGGSGPGIGLSGFLNTASDDFIYNTVAMGRIGTPMKSFLGADGIVNLEESDVNDIIAFLRSL